MLCETIVLYAIPCLALDVSDGIETLRKARPMSAARLAEILARLLK